MECWGGGGIAQGALGVAEVAERPGDLGVVGAVERLFDGQSPLPGEIVIRLK